MHIYYLHHSAVCVVIKGVLLIFDYFIHEDDKGLECGHISNEDIKKAKRVYVFVTHKHFDHFNPVIFEWAKINANVTYILDDTVPKPEGDINAVMLKRGKTYEDRIISVSEFGSTDVGGSFYVECRGNNFFHAGDFNLWHWKDEGNTDYTQQMMVLFEKELEYLSLGVRKIDYAFFPVDKRMGTDHDDGADRFIEVMNPVNFIPIHFIEFSDTRTFRKKHWFGKTNVFSIHKKGQRII